jgi:hypothetical protein
VRAVHRRRGTIGHGVGLEHLGYRVIRQKGSHDRLRCLRPHGHSDSVNLAQRVRDRRAPASGGRPGGLPRRSQLNPRGGDAFAPPGESQASLFVGTAAEAYSGL